MSSNSTQSSTRNTRRNRRTPIAQPRVVAGRSQDSMSPVDWGLHLAIYGDDETPTRKQEQENNRKARQASNAYRKMTPAQQTAYSQEQYQAAASLPQKVSEPFNGGKLVPRVSTPKVTDDGSVSFAQRLSEALDFFLGVKQAMAESVLEQIGETHHVSLTNEAYQSDILKFVRITLVKKSCLEPEQYGKVLLFLRALVQEMGLSFEIIAEALLCAYWPIKGGAVFAGETNSFLREAPEMERVMSSLNQKMA